MIFINLVLDSAGAEFHFLFQIGELSAEDTVDDQQLVFLLFGVCEFLLYLHELIYEFIVLLR